MAKKYWLVIVMSRDILLSAAAAAAGILVAFIGYLFSKAVLLRAPEKFALSTVGRQLLQIGFLVAVYFAASSCEGVNLTYILVAAVLGMTLPMFLFTKKLVSLNESAAKKGKGEKEDG